MNDFITRLFARIDALVVLMGTKLNWLNDNKANIKLDNLPSNLTTAEKSAIRTKIDAVTSADLSNYIPLTQKAAVNGVASLDATGRVPAAQLPSYVDDVVNVVNFVATNPTSGMTAGQKWYNTATKKIFTATSATAGTVSDPEDDKIYVRTNDNTTWRWSGVDMIQINAGLALGITSTTAGRGDWTKAAYDHAVAMGDANVAVPDWSAQLQSQTPNI